MKYIFPAWMLIIERVDRFSIDKKPINITMVSEKIQGNYSYVVKHIEFLENEGIIVRKKIGKLVLLTLTIRGKKVAEAIKNIREVCEDGLVRKD